MKELCKTAVWHTHLFKSLPCNRPSKGHLENGDPVCGIHLRQEKEEKKKQAKWAKEAQQSKSFTEEVQAFADKHKINLNIRFSDGRRTVSINFDVLKKLVK